MKLSKNKYNEGLSYDSEKNILTVLPSVGSEKSSASYKSLERALNNVFESFYNAKSDELFEKRLENLELVSFGEGSKGKSKLSLLEEVLIGEINKLDSRLEALKNGDKANLSLYGGITLGAVAGLSSALYSAFNYASSHPNFSFSKEIVVPLAYFFLLASAGAISGFITASTIYSKDIKVKDKLDFYRKICDLVHK